MATRPARDMHIDISMWTTDTFNSEAKRHLQKENMTVSSKPVQQAKFTARISLAYATRIGKTSSSLEDKLGPNRKVRIKAHDKAARIQYGEVVLLQVVLQTRAQ